MNKYLNQKQTYKNMSFDSKKELQFYQQCEMLERCGKIKDLQRQVKFELLPSQYETIKLENGKYKKVCIEKSCNYYADVVYFDIEADCQKVIDVKSEITRKKPEYVIKRKLLLFFKGIKIIEV